MNIKFYFGCGFVGTHYYMIVDGRNYDFGFDVESDAKNKVINILLDEHGVVMKSESIVFEWDGTLPHSKRRFIINKHT